MIWPTSFGLQSCHCHGRAPHLRLGFVRHAIHRVDLSPMLNWDNFVMIAIDSNNCGSSNDCEPMNWLVNFDNCSHFQILPCVVPICRWYWQRR